MPHTDRILTTHVGSLIRPPKLIEFWRLIEDGKAYDVNVVLENAGTLRIQGCVFGMCESAVWRRQG